MTNNNRVYARPAVTKLQRVGNKIRLYRRNGKYISCDWSPDLDQMLSNLRDLQISTKWDFKLKAQISYKLYNTVEGGRTVDLAFIAAGLKPGGSYNLFMRIKNPKKANISQFVMNPVT